MKVLGTLVAVPALTAALLVAAPGSAHAATAAGYGKAAQKATNARRADHDLRITLLSDATKDVMKAWGAFGEKQNYGKTVQGVIRSTFLVDADGTIAHAQYNVRASGHVARVLRDWPL